MAVYIRPFHASDVLRIMGIDTHGRANTELICPKCKKKKFIMRTDGNKDCGQCMAGSCKFSTDDIGFYAESIGLDSKNVDDRKKARKEILSLLGKDFHPKEMPVSEKAEIPMAGIQERDFVYRSMKRFMPLSKSHVNALVKRGLTNEEIRKLGYLSYTKETAYNAQIIAQSTSTVGIPGWRDVGAKRVLVWNQKTIPGILCPFIDYNGRIQGYHIRRDYLPPQDKDGRSRGKYVYLASGSYPGGTGATTWLHFATDFAKDISSGETVPMIPGNAIGITEGIIKADIIHLLTGLPVIAIPGVNAQKGLRCLLKSGKLQSLGVSRVYDLFDMDYVTNSDVESCMKELKEIVRENGFQYIRKDWNVKAKDHKDLKGYDDFLAYHIRHV